MKELEEALRDGRAHLAVHSAKDLPGELPAGLAIVAVPPREDPRDVVVGPAGGLGGLPAGARVATGSPRRAAQMLEARPDLDIVPIRGNVGTRLEKLAAGRRRRARAGRRGPAPPRPRPGGRRPAAGRGLHAGPGAGPAGGGGPGRRPGPGARRGGARRPGRPRLPARRARAPGGARRRLPAADGRLLRARSAAACASPPSPSPRTAPARRRVVREGALADPEALGAAVAAELAGVRG